MLRLFVFSLLACIYSSHSWDLESSHKEVTLGTTKNVTLECKYDNQDNGKPRIADVSGILIRKFHGGDKWETYARVRYQSAAVLGDGVGLGVSVKGHADTVQNSFLSMTWSVAYPNISGRYACQINGFAEDDAPVDVVTNPVSITGSRLSLKYLLSLVLGLKGQITQMFGRIQQQFVNVTQEILHVNREMITREEMESMVNAKIQEWQQNEKVQWPGGQYALLNTADGCPSWPVNVWTAGYMKFNSESSRGSHNTNSVSKMSHLPKPVFTIEGLKNFVYIRTCKHETNTTGRAWPEGSYCLHRVGGVCPVGFNESDLRLDPEDIKPVRMEVDNGPDYLHTVTYEHFYFCCRQDGLPETPIRLPVGQPFYLYRHNGMCQKVHSAKVTDEWLQIATEEDEDNGDYFNSSVNPDVTLKPAKFSLCYYSKL